MEQGLRILIQLIIEFAPVIANFVQKQNEASLALRKHEGTKQIGELLLSENGTSQISYTGNFYQEKIQQLQLAVYHRETQLKVATQQRETALKLPEVNKILDSWPLRLYPSQILQSYPRHGRTPLKIFLAPPKVKFDKFDNGGEESDIELISAEGLREFLSKYYSLHSSDRPVEFLAGAWDSKRFHSESSIKALFGMLKTEPTLILESEVDGDYLNFRIGYWGLGQENYYYKTISRLPYKEIIEKSAKNRALEWKIIRDELVKLGENIEEINSIGGDNVKNLEILEKLEKWQAKGIDVSKLSVDYQVNRQDFEQLARVLTTCYCLVASWVADTYHLVHHDVQPLLPKLLPSLLEDDALDLQSLQAVVAGYKQLYQALETQRGFWIPELALQLAQSLSHLPDTTWTQEQAEYSIRTWLQLRQLQQQEINPLEAMLSAVKVEDTEYVEKLREYFTTIGDTQNIAVVEKILKAIDNLKQQPRQEYAYEYKTLTEHSQKVTSVAISSNGRIVSGCEDKTIKLWNVNTGELIRTLDKNNGEVSSVALSPNGILLAVGSCKTPQNNVKVWNFATGKLVWTLLGHHKPVNVVNISPDGQILASGSNKIKIWDLHKGERVSTLWHSCAVNAITISSSGKTLVSGTSDNKIRLWNPRTGEPLRTLTGHQDEVKALAISSDEQFLYSGSADKTIKIWHLESGILHTLKGHADVVKTLALSPKEQFLYSGSADKTIKIWQLPSGELLHTLTGHSGAVNSLATTQNSQFLVSGSSDKTIKIWQVFGE